ncbi:hypothetical protein R1sor_001711 [Riccia sorocarpa]|uniref:Uncharacterized protein n=1 Tax=Riccia sorocarpa TaxID=122646 RepID=A0ABD3H2M4_9MARC
MRSKTRWLQEGEAPSRCFFAQLKSKLANESMNAIQLEDSSRTTEKKEIITEVDRYMAELFTREPQTQQTAEAKEEALGKLSKRVSQNQDSQMHIKPDHDEIDRIFKLMKKDKSPGLDGFTTEILLDCWDFIREDCRLYQGHVHFQQPPLP